MIVSTKGRYALRVMLDLAQHAGDSYIPLKEIAERQQISEKYLESILKTLVQNQLLQGLRGKGGGYRLTRPPEEYNVGTILRLAEGNLAPVSCLVDSRGPKCPHHADCLTLPMWRELDELINNFFDKISLADLLNRPRSCACSDDPPTE